MLAEIGRRNNVEVRNEELVAAIQEEARRFPGRERDVVNFYQQNPGAVAQIRAPLYEEKVVDFILELAQVHEGRDPRGADGGSGRGLTASWPLRAMTMGLSRPRRHGAPKLRAAATGLAPFRDAPNMSISD